MQQIRSAIAMEENSAAVECLICFYIDAKHLLKARLLDGSLFIGEMIQYCKQRGFDHYTDKEITSAWKKLVAKYIYLKTKQSPEKENWKYFDIFDSCYEQSDFQDGRHSKFSDDMVWFFIECLLKRKGMRNKQKHGDILNDIHKEFLLCGYLHMSKQDIENKWKYLNSKYGKIKNDPEKLHKFPYFQALKGYYEENENSLVSMIFTRDLTEKLIRWYTEKKVSCVIHGYDSAQVLSEIQSKFAEIGYYFSIEAIKDKWRKLVNVYEYLLGKKEHHTTWIYFHAMRNHFNRNYLLSKDKKSAQIIGKRSQSKQRCPRKRSKSVGAKNNKNEAIFATEPEEIIVIDDEEVGVNKCTHVERSFVVRARSTSPRKRGRPRKTPQRYLDDHPQQKNVTDEQNDMYLQPRCKSACAKLIQAEIGEEGELDGMRRPVKRGVSSETNAPYKKRLKTKESPNVNVSKDVEVCDSSTENAQNESVNGVTHAVQVAKVDQSNISARDLAPVSKQLRDVELLPFKKRLRVDKPAHESEETAQISVLENGLSKENDELTIEQLSEKLDKHPLQIYKSKDKSDKLENCNVTYNDWQRQAMCKKEYQESQLVESVEEETKNNPFILFVVKMDAANNLKANGIIDPLSDDYNDNKKITDSTPNEQDVEVSPDFPEPMDQDSHTASHTEQNSVSNAEVNQSETSTACNDRETLPDLVDGIDRSGCGNFPTEPEPASACCIDLTNNNCDEASEETRTKETNNEHCYSQTETVQAQTSEFVFRKPSLIVKKTVEATESLMSNPKLNNHQATGESVPTGKEKVKEIFISRKELNKLSALKPNTFLQTPSGSREANVRVSQLFPGLKFVSHVIKPGTITNPMGEVNVECNDMTEAVSDSSRLLESGKGGTNEEFESESVISEAPGEDGLKNSLLSTVTEFQEHNNQEFVEIKNLMQQNNLLQRETNRLLRLLLEKI